MIFMRPLFQTASLLLLCAGLYHTCLYARTAFPRVGLQVDTQQLAPGTVQNRVDIMIIIPARAAD